MAGVATILVPVDFSSCSRAALLRAAFVARSFGAELHVIHVWDTPRRQVPDLAILGPGGLRRTMEDWIQEEARKEMERLLQELDGHGPLVVQTLIVQGEPTEQILEYARGHNVDLIVMGTHGRGGLAHLFLGSVTEKVIRRASCPVLAIPRSNDESLRRIKHERQVSTAR
jgi:nucleotide-binding universal stress UspA family protein